MGQIADLKKRIDEQCAVLGVAVTYNSKSTVDELTVLVAELDEQLSELEDSQESESTEQSDVVLEETADNNEETSTDANSDVDETAESEAVTASDTDTDDTGDTVESDLVLVKALKTFTYREDGARVKLKAGETAMVLRSALESRKGAITKGIAQYVK